MRLMELFQAATARREDSSMAIPAHTAPLAATDSTGASESTISPADAASEAVGVLVACIDRRAGWVA